MTAGRARPPARRHVVYTLHVEERFPMPTYSYACKSCGHAFDIHQDFSEDTLTVCPECQGRLRKVFGTVGISFKGSGFYATDSRTGSSTTAAASQPSAADSAATSASGSAAPTSGSGSTSSGSTSSASDSAATASAPAAS